MREPSCKAPTQCHQQPEAAPARWTCRAFALAVPVREQSWRTSLLVRGDDVAIRAVSRDTRRCRDRPSTDRASGHAEGLAAAIFPRREFHRLREANWLAADEHV